MNNIIFYSTLEQNSLSNPISENQVNALIYAIRTKDKAGTNKIVTEICGALTEQNVSLYSFRIMYNKIVNILLSELKVDKESVDKFFDLLEIHRCENKAEATFFSLRPRNPACLHRKGSHTIIFHGIIYFCVFTGAEI